MADIILAPNETIVARLMAQWCKGHPQTVGELYLTNRRLVLVPNQWLSIGFGKPWEISLADVAWVGSKGPFQGGPFVGMAGNRLIIGMKDGTRHIFSFLVSIVAFQQALSAQMAKVSAGA